MRTNPEEYNSIHRKRLETSSQSIKEQDRKSNSVKVLELSNPQQLRQLSIPDDGRSESKI